MKKILAFLASIIAAGMIYPATMVITDISDNIVTLETATGYIYQLEGKEDYNTGDLVSVIMFNNGTSDITDDIIISARYSGFYMEG